MDCTQESLINCMKCVGTDLILSLDVQHVFHVELEGVGAPRAHHAWPLVHLEPAPGSVSDDEVVDIVVCVRIPRL